VLLGDRDLPTRPALTEVVEVGDQQVTQDGLDPVGGQQSVQHRVGLLLVEAVERPGQLVGGQEADEWVEI
jgi:hypothetical protein